MKNSNFKDSYGGIKGGVKTLLRKNYDRSKREGTGEGYKRRVR